MQLARQRFHPHVLLRHPAALVIDLKKHPIDCHYVVNYAVTT
jgi:hypothetical protein